MSILKGIVFCSVFFLSQSYVQAEVQDQLLGIIKQQTEEFSCSKKSWNRLEVFFSEMKEMISTSKDPHLKINNGEIQISFIGGAIAESFKNLDQKIKDACKNKIVKDVLQCLSSDFYQKTWVSTEDFEFVKQTLFEAETFFINDNKTSELLSQETEDSYQVQQLIGFFTLINLKILLTKYELGENFDPILTSKLFITRDVISDFNTIVVPCFQKRLRIKAEKN